ncbi:MAG: serine hydrolase domain-containing protein [Sphingobacteriales bacterium]|jgi:CubicO group peptidase (beta-lactamase class C family)
MKKILISILVLLLTLVALSYTPQFSHLRNFIIWGKHTIHDYKSHPSREITKSSNPQPWPYDSLYNKKEIPKALLDSIDKNNTHAFLVIQNGKLLYERYWDGYDTARLSGSFSAAKSIISLLIGIALDEGKIKSLEEPAGNYLPHFKTNGLDKVRIKDLLTMSSGTNYKESDKGYFSLNASAYYGDDIEYMIAQLKQKEDPGIHWEYRSGDTQVLGLIVEKVFGQSITELVSERFAEPMGTEATGLWLLDGNKNHEKSFCCYNAIARDYARFGQLLLNKGKWNDKQIISSAYVKEATSPASHLKDPTEKNNPVDYYGYQYWILHYKTTSFAMNGLFGQYVYSIPEYNAVVVRLGESKIGRFVHHFQTENFVYIDAALAVLNPPANQN